MENNTNYNDAEEAEILSIEPSALEAQTRGEFDIQVATAHKYPRNIKRASNNALTIATMDVATAQSCGYTLPRAGGNISGPSVHLAKIILQQWGNLRAEAKVVGIDDKHIRCQASVHDLETNVGVRVEVLRKITDKKGNRFSEDMIVVTGNAGNSIALRNAVFNVIPRSIVDNIYKATRETIVGDISDATKLIAKRIKMLAHFKDTYGITEVQLLALLKVNSVEHITGNELIVAYGIDQSLKDGDTTVDMLVNPNGQYTKKNNTADILKDTPKTEVKDEINDALTPNYTYEAKQDIVLGVGTIKRGTRADVVDGNFLFKTGDALTDITPFTLDELQDLMPDLKQVKLK